MDTAFLEIAGTDVDDDDPDGLRCAYDLCEIFINLENRERALLRVVKVLKIALDSLLLVTGAQLDQLGQEKAGRILNALKEHARVRIEREEPGHKLVALQVAVDVRRKAVHLLLGIVVGRHEVGNKARLTRRRCCSRG